jgi:cytochrome c553
MNKFCLIIFIFITFNFSLLFAGDYSDIAEDLEFCASCHGEKGAMPIEDNIPVLAGQHFYYIYVQLKDLSSGMRHNEIMNDIASSYDKKQMKRFAKYFSEQTWPNIGYKTDTGLISKAESAIAAGQCVQCHRGSFEGDSQIPRISNQNFIYLQKTMKDYKSKLRNNSPAKSSLFASFKDEDIDVLAAYLAGL